MSAATMAIAMHGRILVMGDLHRPMTTVMRMTMAVVAFHGHAIMLLW